MSATTATDELVLVDRIGSPGESAAAGVGPVLALGLTDTARQRLESAGVGQLLEDPAAASGADAVLVSTRLPRAELAAAVERARAAVPGVPVVALAHTGGESQAVELVRLGAVGVLAEGNEGAIGAVLSGGTHDTTLLDSFERQGDGGGDEDESARDPVTGLPAEAALRATLTESVQAGDVPRVVYIRVLFLEDAARRLATPAVSLLRRRLAARYRELCRAIGGELYALGLADFALLCDNLSPHATDALGVRLARATESFAPSGQRTLAVAVGHAGPEAATDTSSLTELAQRALVVAAATQRSGVVSAESLALGTSSTTELEAALRMLAWVERNDGHGPGHGERCERIAGALGRELSLDAHARAALRLAAQLHDIGKAALPPEAMAGPHGLDGDALWAYRSHSVRGADFLRPSSGQEVADAVRAHHERWDGTGFPDGLAGPDIPEGARVIALADRYDSLRRGGPGLEPRTVEDALAALRADAGTLLDPDLVRTALSVLAALERDGVLDGG